MTVALLKALGCTLLCFVLSTTPARSAVHVTVSGSTATAQIHLPGGIDTELILSFSSAAGLSAHSLGITAQLVNVTDLSLLLRLPPNLRNAIPASLPVLITVEPPRTGNLRFNDTVRVEVHTDLLAYTPGSRYRLFKAPLNGPFVDITDEVAPGSVRTRGTTGGFSQFLVLLDLRAPGAVVEEKLQRLEAWIPQVPLSHQAALAAQLAAIRSAVAAAQIMEALELTDAFRANVSQLSGPVLPNTWKADRGSINLGGELQAGAATLYFSIGKLSGG